MASLKETLLGAQAYGRGVQAPLIDLRHGGQFGFSPDYASYVSNAAYVRRNVIARLIEAPRGFDYLEEKDIMIATLQALIELHPRSIEGLNMGLSVDVQGTPFGGAGEEQEDPTDVKRARSNPSFTYTERYGRAINRFYKQWILDLIMDPNSKFPGVVTRGGAKPTDLLPDFRGCTVLFMEPDPTHTTVDKAWLCTNMWPKSDGTVEGRRDLTSAGNTQDVSIEFTALTQVGKGVDALAQKLLTQMNISGANPNNRPAFVDDISADVNAGRRGYKDQILVAASTAVPSLAV